MFYNFNYILMFVLKKHPSMKQLFLSLTLGLSLCSQVYGQTEPAPVTPAPPPKPWVSELQTGINLNQSAFSDNWQAGGKSSVAISTFLNGKANRKWDKAEWTNDLQLLYGNIQNQGEDLRKNADRIFFESKYSRQIHNHWNAFAGVNFMSQFAPGYTYFFDKDSLGKEFGPEKSRRQSGFLSPGYLTESFGLEYKPVSYFSAQFGLGAFRHTFVTDQTLYSIPGNDSLTMFGVDKGQNIRNQFVFQFVANFDKEIMKNMFLKARYMMVVDYLNISGQTTVHRLDAGITAKVNRYINVNLSGVVLFDNDQDKDVQFSQVLSLGILYGLSNQPKK